MACNIKLGVSLYCYQDEFARRDMTLEDCIEAVADMGADGIEVLPDMMIRDWKHVSDAFLDQWFGWMDKYGTRPIGVDAFCDEIGIYKKQGREMPFEEAVQLQKDYIDICHKLGGYYVRFQESNPKLTEAVVPYAEDKGVTLGLEIHAPGNIGDERIQQWLEHKDKLGGTPAMGLMPDFGIWETHATPIILRRGIQDGFNEKYVELAKERWAAGATYEEARKEFEAMGATEVDLYGVWQVFSVRYDNPENLRAIMPHIISIHGKFWEMNDDLTEASVDYENPVRILIEEGYDKYICSEYEGGRHQQEFGEVRGVEQTRRHHAMLRNLFEKYGK